MSSGFWTASKKGVRNWKPKRSTVLRSLRDQHKGRLSFIPFARQPLHRLRNPAEYDELHEILSMHQCYVGTMNARDGKWPAKQVEARYKVSLPAVPVRELYKLCGGLPAFLKVAYEALASGALEQNQSPEEWHKQMLGNPAFQRFAQEIWDDHEPHEQAAMRSFAVQIKDYAMPAAVEKYLLDMDILRMSYNEDTVEFFSPLFADFVKQQGGDTSGLIIRGDHVYHNGLPVDLPRLLFRLLQYLYEREGEICPKEALLRHVYPGEVEYNANFDRLSGLLRRLRKQVELTEGHEYIQTVHGQGYRFVQFPQE